MSLVLCRCEDVTEADVLEAVRQGACSVDEVKKLTRAGMGLCQGSTCRRLVAAILQRELGAVAGAGACRPPARPLDLATLARGHREGVAER
ncbi:MAG: (2Fe-2S)-binding protein [Bacillota bacterium]